MSEDDDPMRFFRDKKSFGAGASDYYDQSKVTLDVDCDIEKNFSIGGTVNDHPAYSFNAKVFDVGSDFGIEGGRISKLSMFEDDRRICMYARGWPVGEGPEALSGQQKTVLDVIVSAFPEIEKLDESQSVSYETNSLETDETDEIGELRGDFDEDEYMKTEEFHQEYREVELERFLDEYKGQVERIEPDTPRCPETPDMFDTPAPSQNQNVKI